MTGCGTVAPNHAAKLSVATSRSKPAPRSYTSETPATTDSIRRFNQLAPARSCDLLLLLEACAFGQRLAGFDCDLSRVGLIAVGAELERVLAAIELEVIRQPVELIGRAVERAIHVHFRAARIHLDVNRADRISFPRLFRFGV